MSAATIDFEAMRTLGEVARYHARQRPDAVALAFEGRETTYGDLDRRTNQAARALVAVGKYSARLGPFEHRLAVLDLQHTSPAAVTFALEQGIQVPIARNREEIYREMADVQARIFWRYEQVERLV